MPATVLIRRLLLIVAVLAGSLSGPLALSTAAASRPPLGWADVGLIALAALVGLPLLLGLQALQHNLNALRLGWALFLYAAVYCTVAGVAALFVAALGPGLAPHAWLFIALGVSMLAGLAIVRAVFRRRFARA